VNKIAFSKSKFYLLFSRGPGRSRCHGYMVTRLSLKVPPADPPAEKPSNVEKLHTYVPKVFRPTRAALKSFSNIGATSVTLLCFLCARPGDDLYQVMTFSVYSKV
jgi:hypothetical protein